MEANSTSFSTDSFFLACYLIYESLPLIGVDRTNPRRVAFFFEESEKREFLTNQFLSYQAKVEPNKFATAQKNLKQIIYNNT